MKIGIKTLMKNYFISIIILEFIWWYWFFPNIGLDSSQWTLSSLIQSLSAIFGLLIVIYVFIHTKKSELMSILTKLEPKYHEMLIAPTENGTPFIIKLHEENLKLIEENKYDSETKLNPLAGSKTDYLEELYSLCVLAEYMIMNHNLNYSSQKIRNDLKSTGYFEKRGKKLFYWNWIDRPLMNGENFFFHLFMLPVGFQFEDKLKIKLHDIRHEYLSKDNVPEIRFAWLKMNLFIGEFFVFLCSLITLNIIGDIYAISIATNQSFNYTTTKILIGIFISTGLVVFLLIFKYIFILAESDLDAWKKAPELK